MSEKPTVTELEKRIRDLEKSLAEYQYVEKEQQMALDALQLTKEIDTMEDLIHAVIVWMKKWSGCEAVAVRLRDGEDFPYYTSSGFSEQFVKLEKSLCSYNDDGTMKRNESGKPLLECMCGNILCGRFDPSKNFFTADGSFWSNATTKLLAETTDEDRQARTRNRCNSFGYESVALIPLRSAGETLGLMQFNDHEEGRFSIRLMAVYRRVADHIASFIAKVQAREVLKKSEAELRLAQKLARVGNWQWHLKDDRHTWSDEIYQIYGRNLSLPPAIYPEVKTYFTPESWAGLSEQVENAISEGVPYQYDAEVVRPDGEHRWITARGEAVCTSDGQMTMLRGTVQDITERKQAEEALKESERRFKFLSEATFEGVHIHDRGIVLDSNSAFARMLGYNSTDEIIGQQIMSRHLTPESLKKAQELIDSGYQGTYEVVGIKCNGRQFPVEIISKNIEYHGKSARATAARDITERKYVEQLLKWNIRRNELLSETASQLLENRDPQNLIGDLCRKVMQFIDCQVFINFFEDSKRNKLHLNVCAGIPDEKLLEIEWLEHGYSICGRVAQTGQPMIFQNVLTCADPLTEFVRSIGVQAYCCFPLMIEDRLLGTLSFGRRSAPLFTQDETEMMKSFANLLAIAVNRIDMEKTQINLETQLAQAQKMESVGRLAGGVAHDYNNMLTVIKGYTEMILSGMDHHSLIYADLTEILKAADRSINITRQLLAFARRQTIAPQVIDLNTTVKSMLKMLERLMGENIDIAWLPGQNLWPVNIDPAQIDQILANLCINARDAIADIGKVTIGTKNVEFDELYCTDHSGFIPGEYILLAVSDDGHGMDKETLHQVFEPFFTTKKIGRGTGLGLSTVYGIVKQNNGFINVYSEPGKGTAFHLYLSRHTGKADGVLKKLQAKDIHGQGETILVVEDEVSILKLTQRILEGIGYRVLTAGSPGEALSLAQKNAASIRLLITDVVMPEMNGRDLAERLQMLCPMLKCLFMSGYTANVIAHHGVLDKGVHFIQKPVSRTELAAKVRSILDEGAKL